QTPVEDNTGQWPLAKRPAGRELRIVGEQRAGANGDRVDLGALTMHQAVHGGVGDFDGGADAGAKAPAYGLARAGAKAPAYIAVDAARELERDVRAAARDPGHEGGIRAAR